jgi:hypothetical protein
VARAHAGALQLLPRDGGGLLGRLVLAIHIQSTRGGSP